MVEDQLSPPESDANSGAATDGSADNNVNAAAPADARPVSRWLMWLSVLSAVLAIVTVSTTLFGSDDLWPFAPFRMFSYADDPNGLVKRMIVEGDTNFGNHRTFGAANFGLRRSELEEQTPWREWVPESKVKSLVDVYNSRHTAQIIHAQVVVYTTQLHNGEPDGPATRSVIGDWASPEWKGERVQQGDMPTAGPFGGYEG